MLIKLLFPRGFCAGVNRATSTLDVALEIYGVPIYVYHEIVHNKWVVNYFCQRGAIFINSLDEAPDGSVLLFSAHGVSPEIKNRAKEKNLRCIDASCPLVQKVHREVKQFAEQGYEVVLIGRPHHDEVVGVQGEAPNNIYVVNTKNDIDSLPLEPEQKVAYVTQTTLSIDEAAKTIEYLRLKFPKIIGPSTKDICYATQNRQQAIMTIAQEYSHQKENVSVKAVVIGSTNSSNSIRLKEIAVLENIPAFLVDGVEDLKATDFVNTDVILLTAGASAHEIVVQEVVEYFKKNFNAQIDEVRFCEENATFQLPEMFC